MGRSQGVRLCACLQVLTPSEKMCTFFVGNVHAGEDCGKCRSVYLLCGMSAPCAGGDTGHLLWGACKLYRAPCVCVG